MSNWPANAPPIGSGNNYDYDSNQGGQDNKNSNQPQPDYQGNEQPQPYWQDSNNPPIGSAGAQGPNQTNDPSIGSAGMIQGRPPSDFPYENAPPIGSGGSYDPNHGQVGNAGEGEKHNEGGFFSNLIKRFT